MTLTLEDFTDAVARDLNRRLKKAPPAAGLESLYAARETDGSKRRQ